MYFLCDVTPRFYSAVAPYTMWSLKPARLECPAVAPCIRARRQIAVKAVADGIERSLDMCGRRIPCKHIMILPFMHVHSNMYAYNSDSSSETIVYSKLSAIL